MGQELEKVAETITQGSLQDAGLASAIASAEINTLIDTARRYPRSISVAIRRMCELATIDEQAAEESMYSVPRAGKTIEGPSIRFAEMAAQSWGNSRVASRTVAVDRAEKFVEAEGFFLDAETNVATVARIRRRIVDKYGKLYNEDMILTTSNAAQSIARRNAILAGIPKAAWRKAYDAARHVLLGDISTLANRRADAIKAFQRFGLAEAQVLAVMRVKGLDDIDQEKLVSLRGTYSALINQELTVEELLREISPEKPARAPVSTNVTAPETFSAAVPAAAPAAPEASAEAPQPAAAVPGGEPGPPDDIPDDSVIVANDIISRLRSAATRKDAAKAIENIRDDSQEEYRALPDGQKARVQKVFDELTKKKVA